MDKKHIQCCDLYEIYELISIIERLCVLVLKIEVIETFDYVYIMEAGNRCFDECLPEETNRRIVDVTADVNMCYSEHARRYLNAAGTPRERTYVVGSPMAEVLHDNLEQIKASDILKRLGLEKGKYILLSAHREENIDTEANFFNLMNAVNAMAEKYDMPILYSCHPRSKKFIEQRGFRFDPRVI